MCGDKKLENHDKKCEVGFDMRRRIRHHGIINAIIITPPFTNERV